MFKKNLNKIISGKDLTDTQMGEMMGEIFSGRITDSQVAGFITALATKGETIEELSGAAQMMRKNAIKVQVMGHDTVIDTCGTGGDSADTFNISTTTAFVAAGCNVIVAKHGNRSVSSKCGSADLVEALGVNLDIDPEIVEEAIAQIGIGFLFAPRHHSAMRFAAPARQELGIKSIFNMLGPLSNPAGANCQLLGVYAPELTEMFALALNKLGTKKAFVVHGHDGLDEISVCAPTRVSELNQGQIKTYDIYPEDFFETLSDPEDIKGGDLKTNLQITKDILNGKKGPKRNVVLINAAAALVAAGKADNLKEGILMAEDSIDSRKAVTKLNELITFTQDNA
ncbi:MAG: anthranilate phosphoribosyltransferase [Desulfobacula sp.]|uniref:anthranilate phosphoribosyltransferase n=1 Tax=Desulfobacula sp. TaxID=2593537 RepID=UPI0025BF5A7A|nr:anthranilate phosphoribosyltransferase [Desulfobacula sp.]MCD4718293.1 anthranilate phosphoribosyltransferase [Desulfobacula sp.]